MTVYQLIVTDNIIWTITRLFVNFNSVNQGIPVAVRIALLCAKAKRKRAVYSVVMAFNVMIG